MIDGRAGLISKIEKPSGLDDIVAIFSQSDAIMMARSDLGADTPPEVVTTADICASLPYWRFALATNPSDTVRKRQ